MKHLKPSKAFSTRYSAAKRWRAQVQPEIKEVLRYCAPDRVNEFSDGTQIAETDTFTSIGEEMSTDFAGDLVNYYFPSEQRWSELEVMTPVAEANAAAVEKLVKEREAAIFDLLDMSNFNDLKPQLMFEACHGTMALWMDAGHLTEPIFMEVLPPSEVLITPGHRRFLDRFRESQVIAQNLQATLPNANLNDPAIQKKMEREGATAKVCWGYWLDWSDPGNPQWRHEITIDGKRVTEPEMIIGPMNGACPMLVGRFNPRVKHPWGRGPGRKALPDLSTLNKIEEVVLTKLDDQLDPAWSYMDDGVMDLKYGVEPGMAYPRRSAEPPAPLHDESRLDYGFYTKGDLEERVRVAFYQDGPRQRGDTPPTASQWVDERRRVQARLGKPSAPIATELGLPIIQRAEYLGVQLGMLESAITLNGSVINVRPISPMQRSQDQDKAMISRSNMDTGQQVFGDQFVQVIDPVQSYQNYLKATGDEIIVLREAPTDEA
jgi:hypothetical protein